MSLAELVSTLDSEIATLQQVRSLLAGQNGDAQPGRKARKKRTMSAEGRARIAAAQRARWAKQKRAAKKGRA
jgi:topoisomerase IA-like protein